MESVEYFPLSLITSRIQNLLKPALQTTFWVKGEISSGRSRGGSFYCDLTESDGSGQVIAQLRATIWERDLTRIRRAFERDGVTLLLEEGMAIGALCRVQMHPVYGLSLSLIDMDPRFSLGEIELKRRRILEALEKDGCLEGNRRLELPLVIQRVGLITSRGSAAHRDFMATLEESPHAISVVMADALMQGEKTEASVLGALSALKSFDLDAVVICRGGGSKMDLAWLDNEWIARAVSAYPVPVLTGIGHETDRGVLDMVAARSFKTPTAVAEDLIARMDNLVHMLEHGMERLRMVHSTLLKAEQGRLRVSLETFRWSAVQCIDGARRDMGHVKEALRDKSRSRVGQERGRLVEWKHQALRATAHGRAQRRSLLDVRQERLRREWRSSLLRSRDRLGMTARRLRPRILSIRLRETRRELKGMSATLDALDPKQNLQRGYARIVKENGEAISGLSDIFSGQSVRTHLHDGSFTSIVQSTRRETKND